MFTRYAALAPGTVRAADSDVSVISKLLRISQIK